MSIEVLVSASDPDRLIVGVGPFGDYDPSADGYAKYTLDDSQQAAVYAPTAYLCADHATVKSQPC